MIKLSEIIHSMNINRGKRKDGLVSVDDWRLAEAEYLKDMGFEQMDEYKFVLDNSKPRIVVFKQKMKDDANGGVVKEYYIVDDRDGYDMYGNKVDKEGIGEGSDFNDDGSPAEKTTKLKRFNTFEAVENYFNSYKQPDLDKNL